MKAPLDLAQAHLFILFCQAWAPFSVCNYACPFLLGLVPVGEKGLLLTNVGGHEVLIREFIALRRIHVSCRGCHRLLRHCSRCGVRFAAALQAKRIKAHGATPNVPQTFASILNNYVRGQSTTSTSPPACTLVQVSVHPAFLLEPVDGRSEIARHEHTVNGCVLCVHNPCMPHREIAAS